MATGWLERCWLAILKEEVQSKKAKVGHRIASLLPFSFVLCTFYFVLAYLPIQETVQILLFGKNNEQVACLQYGVRCDHPD